MGGRDDHNSKNNKALGQTPKNQILNSLDTIQFSDGNDPLFDGSDIEFSEELADADDKEAQARMKAANERAKKKSQ